MNEEMEKTNKKERQSQMRTNSMKETKSTQKLNKTKRQIQPNEVTDKPK